MSEEQNTEKQELNGDSKVQIEKAKKNLVYIGIFSVVMFFAGLTSAYIVSMGDSFWVKAPLPPAFWISTGIIIVSSIVLQLAVYMAKKGNSTGLKVGILVTFLLGGAFIYTQVKGYGQLLDAGVHLTGSGVVVSDGRYGEYYSIKQGNNFIVVDGNDYMKLGQKLSEKDLNSLKNFTGQFLDYQFGKDKEFTVKPDGIHTLYWKDQEMEMVDGKLQTKDSLHTRLQLLDRERLYFLALNIRDGRGHFFMKGEYGKDFWIYYKGEKLSYKNGNLLLKGRPLDDYMQLKAVESADTASSYLWGITIAHLLHIIVTMLYMLKLVIRSFTGKINSENNISLRMGAIFWHFLGLLWLYLLLFLLFIH